jgi:2-hydroxychromene-2-carboxylate isomerase
MNTQRIEFHYDFGSPNAYLSHRVLPQIAQRTGAVIEYVPILLGGVFKATNNRSPMEQFAEVKNKPEYQRRETERFIAKHKLEAFSRNPHFPVNTITMMRGAVYARGKSWESDYIETMFAAMWERGLNMADAEQFATVLQESGLPVDEIVAAVTDPAVKSALVESTAESVERGNFGSPSFFVGDELYFGKDKLADFEEEILRTLSS